MPSSRGVSPRLRSRRAPLAALLTALALGACAQILAPAGAAAMTAEPVNVGSCGLVGGTWKPSGEWGTEGCYVSDGAGGQLKLNEVSIGSGTAPGNPFGSPISGLPQQLGPDGARNGREKGPKGGSKAGGSGEVKAPADAKRKDKQKPGAKGTPRKPGDPVDCKFHDALMRLTVDFPPLCDARLRWNGDPCGLTALLKATDKFLADWERDRPRLEGEVLKERQKGSQADQGRIFKLEQRILVRQTDDRFLRTIRAEFVEMQCTRVQYGTPYVDMPEEYEFTPAQ